MASFIPDMMFALKKPLIMENTQISTEKANFNRTSPFKILLLQTAILFVLFSSCATTSKIGAPIDRNLKDGVYESNYRGGPNKVSVKVTIKNNRIIDIQIVEHWAWRGKTAEPVITRKIIENQSTDVDAISGATNSSIVIMNAVQKAVEKAYQN